MKAAVTVVSALGAVSALAFFLLTKRKKGTGHSDGPGDKNVSYLYIKSSDLGMSSGANEEEGGASTKVCITVPNGNVVTLEVLTGYTIGYLKTLIEKDAGITFTKIKLMLKDTELIDPMCIEDYVGQGILKEVIEASERS